MTKKRKIKLLMKEVKNLTVQNQRLKKRENKQIVDEMVLYLQNKDNLNKNIYKEYRKIHILKYSILKNKLMYRVQFALWKVRKNLGI